MFLRRRPRRPKSQRQSAGSVPVPTPNRGIVADRVFGVGGVDGLESAMFMYNVIPGEYGLRVRPGSTEMATGLLNAAAAEGEVRTVMHYNGTSGVSGTKIFAATDAGIYDITAGGAGPHTEVVAWTTTGGNAGWCSFLNWTNVAGTTYLLLCDEVNGYNAFDGTTWSVPTFSGTTPPTADELVHITEWQSRLWFVEEDSGRAWFLDALAMSGNIVTFDVGNRFVKGGHLVQCSTWSLDAGDGMDDKLVQISSEGDVLVWEGTNPASASDMALVGRWVVGGVPEGRRVLSDWGGDVLITATEGVIRISALLSAESDIGSDRYMTKNIGKYIRSEMALTKSNFGWSVHLVPNEGIGLILMPQPTGTTRSPMQFCMNTLTGKWSTFRTLDMVCADKTSDAFRFGTSDGRVMNLTGTVDNLNLAGDEFSAIPFSWLTHSSDLGSAGTIKSPEYVRPYWIGNLPPAFAVQMRYDFDLSEVTENPAPVETDAALWDTSLWDTALWKGSSDSYKDILGCYGHGHHVAFAFKGESIDTLEYVGCDLVLTQGGYL